MEDYAAPETALTSGSIEEHPVERRLETLNRIIGEDFADPVTVEVLDSERRIDIGLHPEIARELAERQRQEEELLRPLENPMPQEDILHGTDAAVDGRDLPLLDERKGWYREEMYGREVEVGQIGVHPAQAEGKYVMTAVIDGRVVSHEITQRDYDRFLAVDDYHRMKLFSKIFSEVEMKPRPETQRGLGVKIFAALTAAALFSDGILQSLNAQNMEIPKKVSPFPVGDKLPEQFSKYFVGQAWLAPLTDDTRLNAPVSNVTFSPGCRNNWHSHTGGQLLIAVGGQGYYQKKGRPARALLPGDIVEIAPDVVHWHGAAPDSWFSHLAVACNPATNENTWLEPVDDAQYAAATASVPSPASRRFLQLPECLFKL